MGEITVTTEGGSETVDQAWSAVEVTSVSAAPGDPVRVDEDRVRAEFRGVLDAAPEPPAHFLLYFKSDAIDLTEKSRALVEDILAEIERRGSVDISLVGHTDTSGSNRHNFELSVRRAREVANLLVDRGVDRDTLDISSHGEENPLVPTPDGVEEPRNRRVEITIR